MPISLPTRSYRYDDTTMPTIIGKLGYRTFLSKGVSEPLIWASTEVLLSLLGGACCSLNNYYETKRGTDFEELDILPLQSTQWVLNSTQWLT